MAWPRRGKGSWFGIGEESTLGTAVSRTHWFRLISESGFKRTLTKTRRSHLSDTGRNRRSHRTTEILVGGTVEIELGLEGAGLLLKHALGAVNTDADTPSSGLHTHTYTLTASLPSVGLTCELIRGSGGQGETLAGCRINKITLKIEAGGLMTASLELIGMAGAARTSASTPAITSNAVVVGHELAGTLAWNSATYTPRSIEWTLDHKLGRRNLLGSLYTADPSPSDYLEAMAAVELEHEADALYAAYLADTASDLAITFTSGTRSLRIELHNAYLDQDDAPMGSPGTITESLRFMSESDGTDEGIEIINVNSQADPLAA